MSYAAQYAQWYCHNCQQYHQTGQPSPGGIWYQNFYRIRRKEHMGFPCPYYRKGKKYWIEDHQGGTLGFSKEKSLKPGREIPVYSDESMTQELFRIQQQPPDPWTAFVITDSHTRAVLGYIRRKALSYPSVWEVYDASNQLIGGVDESQMREPVVSGEELLEPEKMVIELNGTPVAEIIPSGELGPRFKITGKIWMLNCVNVPPHLDRRVLLGGLLLMGMIDRSSK